MKNIIMARSTTIIPVILTFMIAVGVIGNVYAQNPLVHAIGAESAEPSEFANEMTVLEALQAAEEIAGGNTAIASSNPIERFLLEEETTLKNQEVFRWFYRIIVGYLQRSYSGFFKADTTIDELLLHIRNTKDETKDVIEASLNIIGTHCRSEVVQSSKYLPILNSYLILTERELEVLQKTFASWETLEHSYLQYSRKYLLLHVSSILKHLEHILRLVYPVTHSDTELHTDSYMFIVNNLLRNKELQERLNIKKTSLYLLVMFYELDKHFLNLSAEETETDETLITKALCGFLFIRFFLESWAQNLRKLHLAYLPALNTSLSHINLNADSPSPRKTPRSQRSSRTQSPRQFAVPFLQGHSAGADVHSKAKPQSSSVNVSIPLAIHMQTDLNAINRRATRTRRGPLRQGTAKTTSLPVTNRNNRL